MSAPSHLRPSRDATLIEDLRNVIEPATLGDPMRPLLWVSKSYDKLASALQKKGHEISASSVKRLLPTLGYSRQSNRKADEGSKHPDRNAQFEHINAKAIVATRCPPLETNRVRLVLLVFAET